MSRIFPITFHIQFPLSLWCRTQKNECMARDLSDKDLELLKKLAPECSDIICSGSGMAFQSILPPLANHLASDVNDFRKRLDTLTDQEFLYLIDLIRDGSESVACIPPLYARNFIEMVGERFGFDAASEMIDIYVDGVACEENLRDRE